MIRRRGPFRRVNLGSEGPTEERYIFGRGVMFGDVGMNVQDQAVKEARDTPFEILTSQTIEERGADILSKYTLDVPKLDLQQITEIEERIVKLDVSNDPGRIPMRDGRPNIQPGKEVGLAAPFTGDHRFFNLGLGTAAVAATIEDGCVVVHEAGQNLDAAATSKRLQERLRSIAGALDRFRAEAEGYNGQLNHVVHLGLLRLYEQLKKENAINLGFPKRAPKPPVVPDPGREATPRAPAPQEPGPEDYEYDVFLSHAGEDKTAVVLPLYKELRRLGLNVWLDKAQLVIGDSLREKIDEGLSRSRFGVVVLSPSFFKKPWPKAELDGMMAIESTKKEKRILPVWHEVDATTVTKFSSILAGRMAGRTADGIESLAADLLAAVRHHRE